MKRKPSRKQMASLCDALGPQDGLDPRYDQRLAPERRASRKAQQLCAQVAQTLHSVLAGESGDDLLRELTVLAVEPAPNSGRLLVTVGLATPGSSVDTGLLLERLNHAAGRLRAEVAAAIHRRRAPTLAFQLDTRTGG